MSARAARRRAAAITLAISLAPGVATSFGQGEEDNPTESVTVLFDVGHNEIGMDDIGALRRQFEARKSDDGFRYEVLNEPISPDALAPGDIVVFRVPLGDREADNWVSSTRPTSSAFELDEIRALEEWVHAGGGLLVVADHMPMAGAVKELLAAFGVRILDGFVFREDQLNASGTLDDFDSGGWLRFSIGSGSLASHPIVEGRSDAEQVEYLTTDVGSAFLVPPDFESLLTLEPGTVSLMPDTAWALHRGIPRLDVEGWSQVAIGWKGRGRVAILGDAWLYMPRPQFDNVTQAEAAHYHPQFTTNLLVWLAGRLPCP